MTVNELYEVLEIAVAKGDGDKPVSFAYNYGDYWNTTVAQPVNASEIGNVAFSEYHSMNKIVNADDCDGEEHLILAVSEHIIFNN